MSMVYIEINYGRNKIYKDFCMDQRCPRTRKIISIQIYDKIWMDVLTRLRVYDFTARLD